jgi:5'-nucleotidase (lipoprotein e(P4) family)
MVNRFFILFLAVFCVSACSSQPPLHDPANDLGILWVKHAAEYPAITRQVYQSATKDLPTFINDPEWSAFPNHPGMTGLPPAVILDVDETIVSNVDFQIAFERPFTNRKMYDFFQEHDAIPVAGAAEFVAAAREAGVTVFFVTNRPCAFIDDDPDPCPQKAWTVSEIRSIGIETDADHVLLADERGWDRAKIARREHIAERYRIIMLFGDDLGDFTPCVRTTLYGPCTEPASKASRQSLVDEHQHLWGHGWYMLPGPMHGSWTSFTD